MTSIAQSIGGFFALHEPDCGAPDQSILFRWTNGRAFVAFGNARSAFAALVEMTAPRVVWLPAYICGDLIGASWRERARYYRLLPGFEPDVATLERDAVAGDMVLAVDFFGLPPGQQFIEFVRRRRDLLFVDDRAQALDPGVEPWADWTLYSPRKLLGVADGGILVSERPGRQLPQPHERPDAIPLWTAPILRYEDQTATNNQAWYKAHLAKEARMQVDRREITRLSHWILSHTTLDPLAERRRRNWRLLQQRLGPWLARDDNSDAVPHGYVIKVPTVRRAAILRTLHSDRIFAAVHWPSLPSPARLFAAEHELQSQLITLPCDHRYDESAMRSVAQRVLDLVS